MLRISDLRRGDPPPRRTTLRLAPEVLERVRAICRRVEAEGDAALVELTRELDGADVAGRLRVTTEELDAAASATPPELRAALERMAERLSGLHERQVPTYWESEVDGIRFGEIVRPLRSVGCYAPGGRAAYPSTVLMTAVPARVAGVARIALCTPPDREGSVPAPVLYAARVAGVHEVYRVGGAQAVAALAYGTGTVAPVEKIVGPGNVWVTGAKREVAGDVGIDALAGPTELAVVADASADPAVLAADLVAQAEHDPEARTVLICLDPDLPDRAADALAAEVARSPRREIVERAMAESEAVIAGSDREAAGVVDAVAPEHLQVLTEDPGRFLRLADAFGAAFLGPHTPVPFGDYGVGSNHVLPTMGTARFSSGLRAADFVTVSSFVEASPEGIVRLGPEVAMVAEAEGLPGHARAVEVRR